MAITIGNNMENIDIKTQTAKEIKVGTIVYDVFDEGLRFIIMRSSFSWCAYVGVPKNHPLAGIDYDDISFVSAHGGLTFSGDGDRYPTGFYWFGWDYSHAGDKCHYEKEYPSLIENEHDWTIEDVIKDSWTAINDFKNLSKVAEKIKYSEY